MSSLVLSVLTEILLDLEAAIDSFDDPSDRGITKPGMWVEVVVVVVVVYSGDPDFVLPDPQWVLDPGFG